LGFYEEFERNFRGSREEIRDRLERAYAPLLRVVAERFGRPSVLDLGCGRGEWLELAQSFGFAVHGIDLDEGMLSACISRGLSVTQGDAIDYLANQADGSFAIISAFHVAEHLPFDVLRRLISEAFRVLLPGGLLILETPNAENLIVGTLTFHMDPTHNRPLPAGLLSFLARHYRFERVAVLRLQENEALGASESARLIDVLNGVSPDYAVIAQKAGPTELVKAFDCVFGLVHGLTIETLTTRFEDTIKREGIARVEAAKAALQSRIETLEANNCILDLRVGALEVIADEQRQRLQSQWQQVEQVYNSTSWRITWPIRFVGCSLKGLRRSIFHHVAPRILRRLIKVPMLRRHAKWLEVKFPELTRRARQVLGWQRPLEQPFEGALNDRQSQRPLSPRANEIYTRLLAKGGANND
jgi:O-antigen chain-terminating methyltransferase